MATHVGAIVMSMNGQDVEVLSITPDENTGRQLITTMNRAGRARVTVDGVAVGGLTWEVVIPKSGDLKWEDIDDGRIVVETRDGAHYRTYSGVGVSTVSVAYTSNGASVRTLTGFYTNFIES